VIADILLTWNELTATIVVWLGLVSLAVGLDFGPDIYRENKARAVLAESVAKAYERRQAEKTVTFDPDATFQLGTFKMEKPPVHQRRRHAKLA
jgi:hypothetical protein